MEPIPDFLRPLEVFARPFPRAAVEEAIVRREESTPYLVAALEFAAGNPEQVHEDRYMLYEYAMFILAEWREPAGYRPLVRIARHPSVEGLLGDTITEGLPDCLASVCDGDLDPLRELIEDARADEFARSAGIRALATWTVAGLLPRQELSAYMGQLLAERLEREPHFLWDEVTAVCCDLRFSEHLDAIRQAYSAGLANPGVDRLEDVEKEISRSSDLPSSGFDRYSMVTSAVAEMESWYCFTEEAAQAEARWANRKNGEEEDDDWSAPYSDDHLKLPPPPPHTRDAPKVGRNDPCPCGSGKKYKKCCGPTT